MDVGVWNLIAEQLLASAQPVLWTALLVFCRVAPMVLLVPAFGGLRLPSQIRMVLIAVLVAACWPGTLAPPTDGVLSAGPIVASQALLGFACACAAMLGFEAVRMAGILADSALGRGSFGASDPMGQGASTPLGTLYSLLLVAVFFAVGGHRLLLVAVVESYDVLALDAALGAGAVAELALTILRLTGAALTVAVAFVLPAFAAALLVDFSMGWFNRFMPNLPALFLAMPIRSLVGWGIVAATLLAGIELVADLIPVWFAEPLEAAR